MKTLVLSLMRLGDLLMMEPLLKEMKRQNDRELHLLIYKEFAFAKELFPYVDQWHYIDRKQMQEDTRSADVSIFENTQTLASLLQRLRTEKFDSLVSLTHNNLSYHLTSSLSGEINEVIGAHNTETGVQYGSTWIKYLNDIGSIEGGSVYHLIDIYRNALGLEILPTSMPDPNLFYGNEIPTPDENYICIQLGSNEEKKTFSSAKWKDVLLHYRLLMPEMKILLLGAPNEKEMIETLVNNFGDDQIEAAICSLKNAKALIHRAKLLVTPDTSIKYLAMGSNTPVIELSIGSSQYNQTGSYLANSLVVQSTQDCAPCSHSVSCPFTEFKCHKDVPADMLGFLMFHRQVGDWKAIETIAEEYNDMAKLIRCNISEAGFWTPIQLGIESMEENLRTLLHQSSWKIILGGAEADDWKRFELEAQSICQFFKANSLFSQEDIRKSLERCEALLLGYELETQELIRGLGKASFQDSTGVLTEVSNWFERSTKMNDRIGAFARLYAESSNDSQSPDNQARGAQHILDNLNHMFKIERKLSEIIRVDYMEAL